MSTRTDLMTQLSFEEQDLIIDKLIEKFIGSHKGCGNTLGIIHPVFNMVTFVHPAIDYNIYSPDMFKEEESIKFDIDGLGVFVKEFTIQELQRKYFQDILTPTHNEMIMFELTEGFEYPLQDKFLKKEKTNE